jgi:FdhD protein
MEMNAEEFAALECTRENKSHIKKAVALEFLLTIFLNGKELVTLLCSPQDMKYLAVGFLVSEGLLKSEDEIKKIEIEEWEGIVRVETVKPPEQDSRFFSKRIITSGCGGGATFFSDADIATPKVASQMKISVEEVFELVKQYQHHSELYLSTHGVHSAALCDRKTILVFNEDIGRHNAVDKVFGKCFLEGIANNDCALISSGRISSEIMHKIAKRGIPIVISISAPTSLGVKIADKYGITLIASARGGKFIVYSQDWRVE